MGYFDGLTDACFKNDSSSNPLFYPWGVIGSGFVLESEEKKKINKFFMVEIEVALYPARV